MHGNMMSMAPGASASSVARRQKIKPFVPIEPKENAATFWKANQNVAVTFYDRDWTVSWMTGCGDGVRDCTDNLVASGRANDSYPGPDLSRSGYKSTFRAVKCWTCGNVPS